jgi:beta-glucosidase
MDESQDLIQQMTLEEKASLCSGKNFWHLQDIPRLRIPSIMVADGPHGLRKQIDESDPIGVDKSLPATCFPTASALAATWNRDLVYQIGVALGEECRQEKVSVLLGPGVNIKRSPLCGRNFEYFSEDPYLTGELAKSYINGVQSQGVGASLKHYAANNQETRRMTIDTIVDERTLREIYLTGFEIAVKQAQPWTVMCAYNRINGIYASDHANLMQDILKGEWGHQGLVVSDWGAMNNRVEALKAGVELEMPGVSNGNDELIAAAVRSGDLDETVLDRAVERILTLIFKAQANLAHDFSYDPQAHHALARRTASEGAVLLKNEGNLLPLKPGARIALVGRFARSPRYQGAGSSLINPSQLDNLYDELAAIVGEPQLIYAPGYPESGDYADETLIQEALAAIRQADITVICAGLTDMYEVEGMDRSHMNLPAGHDALIERLAVEHRQVVVVLSNGSPVQMPWANDVPAILEAYLGGQAGAGGIADLLTGKVNPNGKLAETFPHKLQDTPAQPYPGGPAMVEYRESIYIGYRYYDAAKVEPLFPFGHGLSYTSFTYRDLTLVQAGETVSVQFKVNNSGAVFGQEIVQLYVRDLHASVFRPGKELKGFTKVALAPGEETDVTLTLDPRAFAFYDVGSQAWVVEPGEFEILVGASSRDIRLSTIYQVTQAQGKATPMDKAKLAAYFNLAKDYRFTQADMQALLGRPVPLAMEPRKGSYTLNTPIDEMKDSFIGKQLHRIVNVILRRMIKGHENTPTGALVYAAAQEMPLRSLLMYSNFITRPRLEALLLMVNGHFYRGLLAFFKSS